MAPALPAQDPETAVRAVVKGPRSLHFVHDASLMCTDMPDDEPKNCPMLAALRGLRDFYEEHGDPSGFDDSMRQHLARLESMTS